MPNGLTLIGMMYREEITMAIETAKTNINELHSLLLGHCGEENARTIKIDVSEWMSAYPQPQISLILIRPTEDTPYPAVISVEDGVVLWTVSKADCAIAGEGKGELRADFEDGTAKSYVFKTIVTDCLPGTVAPEPPEAAETWVDKVLDAANDILSSLPVSIALESGDLVYYDQAGNRYDLGYVKGADGFSPTITVKEDTDTEFVMTVTDAEGSFDTPNLRGGKGRPGDKGDKGDKGDRGEQGIQGENGEDGFSPTITVKEDTSTSYKLTITDVEGSFDTPNLKGNGDLTNYYTKSETEVEIANGFKEHYITTGQKSGTTLGSKATAEGVDTTASGNYAHSEGYMSNATANNAHSEGNQTTASGNAAHTEGISSVASGYACHAEGNSEASGNYAHSEGQATKATADRAHAEGYQSEANGECSHAEGRANKANGANSHTSGQGNIAGYSNQTVVGKFNDNKTDTLFEVGNGTSDNSRSNAMEVTSSGKVIAGTSTSAADSGTTLATKDYVDNKQPDLSNYVTLDTAQTITREKTITVGLNFTNNNRTSTILNTGDLYNLCLKAVNQNVSVRAAAFIPFGKNASNLGTTVYTWNNGYITNIYGDTGTFTGSVTSGGADYAEYFEWFDGNPDGEDRIGRVVALDGDKIRYANFGDEILGITSGTVAFLGDNYETEWQGKYLRDNFGRYIYEEYEYTETEINEETGEEYEVVKIGTRPKLNPDYDPETEYISRSQRAEWETVGMLGKLYVEDDGSCEVNGYVTVSENGIATASVEKTNIRVLARVTENIIKVLLK